MDRKQILDELKGIFKIIKPSSDIEKITEGSNLLKDIGIDSLSMLLMALAIEEKFSFKFENMDRPFNTVGEVIDHIEKNMSEDSANKTVAA
ncbi:MAG: hypothetical protein J5603_04480 [Bacteroidales bacterium]|nr:hypothetical protein [Bacteroidales bacterium]MBR5651616.1 hypothetical protein [Bacteroidales bacterium]